MAKTSQLRAFFGGGEQDPRLAGRVDRQKNLVSLALCENFFPSPIGGLEYRPGLKLRRVLFSQRHPDRVKIVRAPGYTGAAERILLLDGSNDVGKIEVYAFPYAGNTRFTLTDIWSRSENRPATVNPNVDEHRNPIPANIHEARVSYGDYAGTMLCHQDFAPLHVGSATITELATVDVTVFITLAIDPITNQLWQISPRTPQASEELGRMPSAFSNAGGMTTDGRDVLAIAAREDRNALWRVNRSNARLSRIEGILNVTGNVTGFAKFNDALYCVTDANELWLVDRNVTIKCIMRGEVTAVPAGATIRGLTQHDDELIAIDSAGGLLVIDPDTPGSSTREGTIGLTIDLPYVETLTPPNSIASSQGQIIVTMETESERSDVLVAVNRSDLATRLIGYLPVDLLDASAMATIDVILGPYDRLGSLYDEATSRTDNQGAGNMQYFTPKNYVDHLGNAFGEGSHPACATAFLNRMVMGGSRYLPGTFIGSELYPRPAADIGDDVNNDAYNGVFSGLTGEAVAVYNFYWLYYHPRKKQIRTWETTTAHDSFSYKIAAERELQIVWMMAYNNYLVIGSSQGVWIARNLAPDTPPEITQYANIPCGDVDPVITDFGIAYADSARREVHIANLGVGFEPPQRLNLLADARHITEGTRIRQLAWQATPQRRLWLLTEAGTLAALCYEPDSDPPVLGWVRVTNADLRFCGVCVVPGEDYEVAVVLAHAAADAGVTTLYITTLDGRDHVDIGVGKNYDFTDDALVPPRDPGLGAVVRPQPVSVPLIPQAPGPVTPRPPITVPPVRPPDPEEQDLTVDIDPVRSVDEGESITLLATATPSNDVTYTWAIDSGPGTIVGDGRTATYTAPDDVQSSAVVVVTVTARRLGQQAQDAESFTVLSEDSPPPPEPLEVVIAAVQSVEVGQTIEIRSTATPADAVTYLWRIVSGPGSIFGTGRTAEYTAPESISGTTNVTVGVIARRDGVQAEDTETFEVLELDTPVEFSVSIVNVTSTPEGSKITLTASASGNAPGTTLYAWSILSGPGSLGNQRDPPFGDGSLIDYTAPDDVASDQSVKVRVVATRDTPHSASDEEVFTVTNAVDPEETLNIGVSSEFHFALFANRWELEAIVTGTATGPITYEWKKVYGFGSLTGSTTSRTATWQYNQVYFDSRVELTLTVTRAGRSGTITVHLS